MTEKSHVSMEQHICEICGTTFDSGAILLERRFQKKKPTAEGYSTGYELRQSLDPKTITGYGTCSPCQEKIDAGYIAIVGIDETKSTKMVSGNIKPKDAYRTGTLLHVRSSAWENIFDTPPPKEGVCFCDTKTMALLVKLSGEAE